MDDLREQPVDLAANTPVYYVEELSPWLPTPVCYEHDSEFWWNVGYLHDKLLQEGEMGEPMGKFVAKLRILLQEEREFLGQAIYIKPSPQEQQATRPVGLDWCLSLP